MFFDPPACLTDGGSLVSQTRPLKVVPDYRGRSAEAKGEGDSVELEKSLADSRKRARAWISQREEEQQGRGIAPWRPRKRHRVASGEVLMDIDNMLQSASLGRISLQTFAIPEASERTDPTTWPSLSIARDGGSDLCCPVSFLQRHLKLNVDETPDPSHLGWRAVIAALKRSDLWSHMTVMMCVWNTPHGAWCDDTRYRQVLSALNEKALCENPHDDVLFQELLSDMLDDMRIRHKAGDPVIVEEMWATMLEDGPWRKKGARLTSNRFLGTIEAAVNESRKWSMREYVYTYVCLELDMFKKQKLYKARRPQVPQAPQNGSDKAKTKDPTAELKLLKAACENSMVLAAMTLMNKVNRSWTRIVAFACKPCLDWHSEQNRQLRSAQAGLDWLSSQIRGGFWSHMNSIGEVLADSSDLEGIGISSTFTGPLAGTKNDAKGEAILQCELASKLGDLVLSLFQCRLRRFLWLLRGWPARTAVMVKGGDSACAERATNDLRTDYNAWQEFKAMNSGIAADMYARSIFELTTVQQTVQAMVANDWVISESTSEMFRMKCSRLVGTQLIEDGFREQRRKEQVGQHKQGRPQALMQTLIQNRVINERHSFREACCDERLLLRGAAMPQTVFHPQKQGWTRLKEIVSYDRSGPWWSTSPEGHCMPYADLDATLFVLRRRKAGLLKARWMSCMLRGMRVLIREKKTKSWFFCIGDFGDTAAYAWPAELVTLAGSSVAYVPSVKVRSLQDLLVVLVLDDDTYEALQFEWVAPVEIWARHPSMQGRPETEQVVALPTGRPASLLDCACRSGLYDFGKHLLDLIAHLLGLNPKGKTVFELCFDIVKTKLKLDDDEAVLSCLLHRVAAQRSKASASHEEVLQMIEIDGMDQEMEKQVKEDQKDRERLIATAKEFHTEWAQRKQRVASARGAASSSSSSTGKRDRKKQPGGDRPRYPAEAPMELAVLQKNVAQLCPQGGGGGHIWRGNGSATWQCHFPPFSRRSFAARVHGEKLAIMKCLRYLWECFNLTNARPETECPIRGIFDDCESPGGLEVATRASGD